MLSKIFYFYLSKAIDKAFPSEYNNYNKSYQYDGIFLVRRCEVMAKFMKVLGVTMRYMLAGVLIVGHLIMSCVGILVTAITSQD